MVARKSFVMGMLLAALLGTGGCFVPVAKQCPGCQELVLGRKPPVPAGTRTVFLIVPGVLGYGWEWTGAQEALARYPNAAVLVYSWEPWHSMRQSGARLAEHIEYLNRRLPASVQEEVIIAHSAAGLLALEAANRLRSHLLRSLHLRLITVGAPLAGMGVNPWGGENMWHTPLPLALGSRITAWQPLAPRVTLEVYDTGAADPVLRHSLGHNPADPRVLPAATRVKKVPSEIGHNWALGWLCQQLLAEAISIEKLAAASSQAPRRGLRAASDLPPLR